MRLLAIVLGLLLVGPFLSLHWMERQSFLEDAKALDAELDRARALGLRLESAPASAVGEEENAAPIYAMAKGAFEAMADDYRNALVYGFPAPTREMMSRSVEAAEPVFRALEQAVRKPQCVFPEPRDPFGAARYPWGLIKLCTARANLMARHGRLDEALRSLEVGAAMVLQAESAAERDGYFEEWTAANALIESLLSWAAELSTNRQDLRARGIVEDLSRYDPLAPMRDDLVRRYTIYRHLDSLSDEYPEDLFERIGRLVYRGDRYFDVGLFRPPLHDPDLAERAFRARLLRRWNDFFEAALKHPRDLASLRKDLDALENAILSGSHRMDEAERSIGLVGRAVWRYAAKHEATVSVANASMALLRHRRETGSFPATLDPVGEWIDPIDRQPLRYFRRGGGFVLYSVGPDGVDDGGRVGEGFMGCDVVASCGVSSVSGVGLDPAPGSSRSLK